MSVTTHDDNDVVYCHSINKDSNTLLPQAIGYTENKGSHTLLLRLRGWPFAKPCTAVECEDGKAERVFSTLKEGYPMESPIIAKPVAYGNKDGLVAYERYSTLTLSILKDEEFPPDKVYDTLRCTIAAMFDLHEVGVGGLPPSISKFVRTEYRSGGCKLYYASAIRRYCGSDDEWDAIVENDYKRMEEFARELIEQPVNSVVLKKSDALFQHFLVALRNHCKTSFRDKGRTRLFVTGHPLLMTYKKVQKLLEDVGWCTCQTNDKQDDVRAALSQVVQHDWTNQVLFATDNRYIDCLNGRSNGYNYNTYFVEYCWDLMGHPNKYKLFEDNFDWDEMIRQFEIFYPSYLGQMWVALCNEGVYFVLPA